MASVGKLPLYNVVTPYKEEGDAQDVSMASAKSYKAALDSFGIPATIKFSKSIKHEER